MDSISYKEAIRKISDSTIWPQKAMFVAIMAENMLYCYEFFHRSENWGNPEILKESISLLYQSVFTNPNDLKEEASICLEKIYIVAPDLDDFEGGTASYGLDSCVVIDDALNFLHAQSSVYIERVVNAIANTLDMYIQEKENIDSQDPNREDKIANDPYMLNEIGRQIALVSHICKNIQEQPVQSDYWECQKVNAGFGPVIDFTVLLQE